MIGNVIERDPWLMVSMVEKIFEIARLDRRRRQSQAHELCIRAHLVDSADDGIVARGVLLRCGLVFELHLVEHFPDGKVVMVARRVLFAILIGEAAHGVPTYQPGKVLAQILA